jgi:fatty-acyl-CoA synthase
MPAAGGAMVDRIPGLRRKLRRFTKTAIAVKRLFDAGILDLGNLGMTLETAKNAEVYGPQASLTIQGGRKYP